MYIGEKIAEVRRLNKLTQRDLAEKLNVSDKVISKWETGKSLPDVETMMRLSKVLGVSISELYECVEKTDTEKMEEYSEERLWQYKKYSIASYFLVVLSPALFLLTAVKWTSFYDLEDVFNFTLTIGAMASLILGLLFQVTGFVRLYSYSKTKFYQEEYKGVLRKYGVIFLICLAVVLLFPLILFIISLFIV